MKNWTTFQIKNVSFPRAEPKEMDNKNNMKAFYVNKWGNSSVEIMGVQPIPKIHKNELLIKVYPIDWIEAEYWYN